MLGKIIFQCRFRWDGVIPHCIDGKSSGGSSTQVLELLDFPPSFFFFYTKGAATSGWLVYQLGRFLPISFHWVDGVDGPKLAERS